MLRISTINIKNAHYRHDSLEESRTSVWDAPQRRQQPDMLSKRTINAVREWWSSKTRVFPKKKDVVRKRVLSSKIVEEHATHDLLQIHSSPL